LTDKNGNKDFGEWKKGKKISTKEGAKA